MFQNILLWSFSCAYDLWWWPLFPSDWVFPLFLIIQGVSNHIPLFKKQTSFSVNHSIACSFTVSLFSAITAHLVSSISVGFILLLLFCLQGWACSSWIFQLASFSNSSYQICSDWIFVSCQPRYNLFMSIRCQIIFWFLFLSMSYLEDFLFDCFPTYMVVLSFYYLFPTSVSYGLRIYSLYDFNLLDFVETSFVAQYTVNFIKHSFFFLISL